MNDQSLKKTIKDSLEQIACAEFLRIMNHNELPQDDSIGRKTVLYFKKMEGSGNVQVSFIPSNAYFDSLEEGIVLYHEGLTAGDALDGLIQFCQITIGM